jgi:hypothetical protein
VPDVELDLDRALAPLLERPLAEPDSLPDLEWRAARVRRRRWTARVGAAAGAAAIAVVAVAALPDSADHAVRTTPPADAPSRRPDPLLPPRPPGAPDHRPPTSLPRVTSIVVGGEQWHLLAGYDADGNFCSGLENGGMGTYSCAVGHAFGSGDVLTAEAAQDMRLRRPGVTLPPWEPPFLSGMVVKDVATVRVEFLGGGEADVPVAGSEAGLPVNFYMAPLPPGADIEAIVALDGHGGEIGRLSPPFWWEAPPVCDAPLPDGGPCLPPGPPEPVSSVTEFRTHPEGPG